MKPANIYKHTLPNGVTVLVERAEQFKSAAVALSLLGGSTDETTETIGLTHLLEHVLFKRTLKKSTRDIARTMDSFGGHLNAFTDIDSLSLVADVQASRIETLIRFFCELIDEPAFSEDDLRLEKDVIRQEIAEAYDDPQFVVYDTFSRSFWPKSVVGLPVFGRNETVATFSREQLLNRLKELCVGKRMVLAAAGNVDPDKILRLAESLFSSLLVGSILRSEGDVSTGCGVRIIPQPTGQVYFVLGRPWPCLQHEQFYTGELVSTFIGEAMSSRLFQLIREEQGLAYDIGSGVECYAETAAFLISANVERANVPRAIELISSMSDDLFKNGAQLEEIELAKQSALAQLEMEGDSIGGRLWRLIGSEVDYGRYESREEVAERVAACQPKDVQKFLSDWFAPGRGLMVLGGDVDGIEVPSELTKLCGDELTIISEEAQGEDGD